MKTRNFLMLMAAMLLSCASAFAQSGNNTPAKGDVNDDGTVDVADIVAVIDIMKNGGGTATVGYFYLGTTQPTAENYKALPGVVNTYSSIDEAVGATASVAAGETVYMLCPAAWVSGKNVTLEDKTGNAIDFLEEKDATTISGYVIYKTQALNAPNDVVLKTQTVYYWYVGYNQDAYDNPETFKDNMYTTTTNAIPTEYSKDGSNGLDISKTGTHPNYLNMILPSSWDVPTIWDESKQGIIIGYILKENVVIKGLKGTYKVWGGNGNDVNDNIIYIN